MGWISVKDKLPEYNKYVLVAFRSMYHGLEYHCCEAKLKEDGRWVHMGNDNVSETYVTPLTHWRPLLEPPEAEE